ncbi:MAG: hypothetical protein ACRCYU_21940 [Nocardioides sp.]
MSFALMHCGSWFAMVVSNRTWVGSWKMALDWAAGSTIVVGPLLAGLVAVRYAEVHRTSLPELVASSVRPMRSWFGPALRLWLLALGSLGLLVVELTVLGWVRGLHVVPRQLLILVPCALVLAVHALVGMVTGSRMPGRYAAPLAAAAAFGLFLLSTLGLAPDVFATGGVTGSLAGEQYRLSAVVLLTGSAALLLVALVLLAGAPGPRWLSVARLGGAVGAGLVAFTVSATSALDIEGRLEPAAADYVCRGVEPQVCGLRDTPLFVGDAAARMHQLSRPLVAVGVRLPDRWNQYTPGRPADRSAGGLSLSSDVVLGSHVPDLEIIRSLTTPATCVNVYDGSEPESSTNARLLLARWIAFRNGLGDTSKARAWFSAPESEQWVRKSYDHLTRCEFDELRRP